MPRTTPTRLPYKASTDRADLEALMADVIVGHVGLVDEDGHPVVIPTAVVLDGDRLLIHGSTGSRWMRAVADGAPICVTVTSIDGVVVARTAFESSLSYRSAVFFGSCQILHGEAKDEALELVTDRIIPGRAAEVRTSSKRELAATLVLEMLIDSWSLKAAAGPPTDEPEDIAGDAWAGNLWIEKRYAPAHPSPDLTDGIPIPPSVTAMLDRPAKV